MTEELSEEDLELYSRQITLEDMGYNGQLKLKRAKVCVIGLGGLGVPTVQKLTAMGVGYIRIVDRDIVSRSDLHRQYLYSMDLIGYSKVEAAAKKLRELNPTVKLDAVPASVMSNNIYEIVKDIDVVLDGLDSIETRYLINRACVKLKIPYVYGGAIESQGNVSTILPGRTVCLECFYPDLQNEVLPKCSIVGVHPSVLSIVSSVQVSEAVKLLTGREPQLLNKLLVIDLETLSFDKVELARQEYCRVCGEKPAGPPMTLKDKLFEEECARSGKRTFIFTPKIGLEIDFKRLLEVLKTKDARINVRGELGVTFDYDSGNTLSILKSGVMIAQAPSRNRGRDPGQDVFEAYHSIMVDGLGIDRELLPNLTEIESS